MNPIGFLARIRIIIALTRNRTEGICIIVHQQHTITAQLLIPLRPHRREQAEDERKQPGGAAVADVERAKASSPEELLQCLLHVFFLTNCCQPSHQIVSMAKHTHGMWVQFTFLSVKIVPNRPVGRKGMWGLHAGPTPGPSRRESRGWGSRLGASPSRSSRWSRLSRAATRLEPPLKGSGRRAPDMCLAAAESVTSLALRASPSGPKRDHWDDRDNRDGAEVPRRQAAPKPNRQESTGIGRSRVRW